MPADKLKQYMALRADLVAEKRSLEQRLAELTRILGGGASMAASEPAPAPARRKLRRARRLQNAMSLKDAILKVNTKPMSKVEILSAVLKNGYKFTTRTPMNSVNVILYGKRPRFKNEDGKFSPVGT